MPTGDREQRPADELEVGAPDPGDAADEDEDGDEEEEEEELESVGENLGLGLMAFGGLVIGAATVTVLWMLYPPTRGHKLPIQTIGIGSVVLVAVLWGVLGRRLGRRAADWLVVGYGIAWIVFSLAVAGTSTAHFLRRHAVQSHGVPTS